MRQATKWGVNAGVAVAGQDNGRLPGPTGKRSRHDPSPFLFFFKAPSLFPHGPTGRMNGRAQIASSPPPPPPPPAAARKFKTFGLQSNRTRFSPPLLLPLLLLLLPCASLRDRFEKKILHEHSASLPTLQMRATWPRWEQQ